MIKAPQGYTAVRENTGWRDLSSRGKLEVTGPDRVSFLHAMVSNDVESLSEFEGRYSTLLTATGKIIADFFVYRFNDNLLLDVTEGFEVSLSETLNSYIIMDDVEVVPVPEFGHISLQGPKSSERVSDLFGGNLPDRELSVSEISWKNQEILIIRKSELHSQGLELVFPNQLKDSLLEELEARKIEFISEDAYSVLRVESMRPMLGLDFSSRNNPVEINLQDAYSLKKGCYVGQEVISRATHIGNTARKLVLVEFMDSDVPSAGDCIYNGEGKEIGKVTSAVYSPRFGKPIGFAFLKRAYTEVGSSCFLKENLKIQVRIVTQFN